jgi:hypothetical protein
VKKLGRYLFQNWLSLDMLVNTLTGGRPGETVSLRAARAAEKGLPVGCALCKFLDALDPWHCLKSIMHAEMRGRS